MNFTTRKVIWVLNCEFTLFLFEKSDSLFIDVVYVSTYKILLFLITSLIRSNYERSIMKKKKNLIGNTLKNNKT